jgi:Holliday junction DNA helicase RuvA
MIARLRGLVVSQNLQKDHARVILDVNGIGYEILMGINALPRLTQQEPAILFVFQAVAPYDGSSILYGFPSLEEREIFLQLKEHVPGIGPKKALESLDRITKSLPDFKRAVLEKDVKLLVGVFGFSRKTAEKLVYSLRDHLEGLSLTGREKWSRSTGSSQEAVSALVALGYPEREARQAVESALETLPPSSLTPELLKTALKGLAARASGAGFRS